MEQRFVAFNVEGMNNVDRMVSSLLSSAVSHMNDKAKGQSKVFNKTFCAGFPIPSGHKQARAWLRLYKTKAADGRWIYKKS